MEAWRFPGVCAFSPSRTFEARAGAIVAYTPFCRLLSRMAIHTHPLEKSIGLLDSKFHGFW
jgi:hypothetical protein